VVRANEKPPHPRPEVSPQTGTLAHNAAATTRAPKATRKASPATKNEALPTMTSSASNSSNGPDDTTPDPRKDSLIEYPCLFPVKVMGLKTDGFFLQMAALAQRHDPFLDPASIAQRDSSSGKYISLTITITATSREHLDNFYRALTSHPLVKYAL